MSAKDADDKENMRKRYLEIRKLIDDDRRRDASMALAHELLALPEFKNAQTIYAYDSFGSELDLKPAIISAWNMGKAVAFPRCDKQTHTMSWHVAYPHERMERSSMGMREPAYDTRTLIENHCKQSIVLVPGVVFDEAGNRIGYGGGYYDRFLPDFPGISIGVCFDEQKIKAISCADGLDVAVDKVISV